MHGTGVIFCSGARRGRAAVIVVFVVRTVIPVLTMPIMVISGRLPVLRPVAFMSHVIAMPSAMSLRRRLARHQGHPAFWAVPRFIAHHFRVHGADVFDPGPQRRSVEIRCRCSKCPFGKSVPQLHDTRRQPLG